jgi:hypothetical protein
MSSLAAVLAGLVKLGAAFWQDDCDIRVYLRSRGLRERCSDFIDVRSLAAAVETFIENLEGLS